MLASTTASVHLLVTPRSLAVSPSQRPPCLSSSVLFVVKPRFRRSQGRWFVPLGFVIGGGGGGGGGGRERRCGMLGFYQGWHCGWSTGFVRRCRDWEGEGDFALEAEILEFMKSSKKPEAFPSRRELVDAGRMDLAEAIVKRGGWLSMGWDLDEEEGGGQENEDFDSGTVSAMELDDFRRKNDWSSEEDDEIQASSKAVSSCPYDYPPSASSSGRTLEIENTNTEHETGIEGILSRLERERNRSFGLGVAENEDGTFSASNNGKDDWRSKFSSDATVGGFSGSSRSSSSSPKKAVFDESGCMFNQNKSFSDIDLSRNSHKPEPWGAWSTQQGGFSDIGSEVIEISSSETSVEGLADISIDEKMRASDTDPNERNELGLFHELIDHNQLRTRLKHLEFELSSVLYALRSKADEIKDHESSSDDLQILSDAWEFQENEIMTAYDKLRSIRAKLAVLEGKMALAIIDAQKIMEEKQKRIDGARRALRLLRPTCIVWPSSASEVLLAGSFDGWATQRRMEKSNTGIFSLWLQLYPGRYEIKFIVDGEWRIDPLRPIVTNNVYQNNLLIIT